MRYVTVLASILLLCAVALFAAPARITLRINRDPASADSLVRAALMIEPRLSGSRVDGPHHVALIYVTDSLGDTLRLAPLVGPGVSLVWSVDSLGAAE